MTASIAVAISSGEALGGFAARGYQLDNASPDRATQLTAQTTGGRE